VLRPGGGQDEGSRYQGMIPGDGVRYGPYGAASQLRGLRRGAPRACWGEEVRYEVSEGSHEGSQVG